MITRYRCGPHLDSEDPHCWDCSMYRHFNELQDENVRLREALERILKASMPHEEPVSRAIARDALEGRE